MGEIIKVARASEVSAGTIKSFEVHGRKIAIANSNGKFFAFEDHCPHMGAQLSTGLLLGNIVMCKVHGEQFDLTTGNPLMMLSKEPLKTYPVKVEGDEVLVEL